RNDDGSFVFTEDANLKKFFLFDVYDPNARRWIQSADAMNKQAWHWAWVSTSHNEIDTVADLEWLMSDRDRPEAFGRLALPALAKAIDQNGTMGIYDGTKIPDNQIHINEGMVSFHLADPHGGRLAAAERMKYRTDLRKAAEQRNPRAVGPLDPAYSDISP